MTVRGYQGSGSARTARPPRRLPTAVSTQNTLGRWVPAIPLPLYERGGTLRLRIRCRCECGESFRSERAYRGHYAYAHVLGMEES